MSVECWATKHYMAGAAAFVLVTWYWISETEECLSSSSPLCLRSVYTLIVPSVTQLIVGKKGYRFQLVNVSPFSGLSYLEIAGKKRTVHKYDRPENGLVILGNSM
jgi:hypothetical protein